MTDALNNQDDFLTEDDLRRPAVLMPAAMISCGNCRWNWMRRSRPAAARPISELSTPRRTASSGADGDGPNGARHHARVDHFDLALSEP
jgi:hypothetical protein